MAQLDYLSSQRVEEVKQQLLCNTEEINKDVNFLGPLIAIPYINEIEDINVLENLEKGIIDLINCIQAQKEKNLQELHYNNEFYYPVNGGQHTMLPHNPVKSQSKDNNEFNFRYVPMNDPAQHITWAAMDGIEQTVIDQPAESIPVTDTAVSRESEEIADILQNKGGINGNGNVNGNTKNNFEMKGLPEASIDGGCDFLDYLLEQDALFPEENAEQGVGAAIYDSNFQNWGFKTSNF